MVLITGSIIWYRKQILGVKLGDDDIWAGIICLCGFWILHGDGLKNVMQAENRILNNFHSKLMIQVQFSSVTQSCPTLCDPMNHSMPGLPVHNQLLEFTQTHVHRVSNAIQPSHPLSSLLLLPPSESFPMSQLFAWGGQSTEVSALACF